MRQTRGALVKTWAYAALVGIAIIIASSAEAGARSTRPFVQGVYVGKGSRWDLHADIRRVGPNRYKAVISAGSPNCASQIEVEGSRSGKQAQSLRNGGTRLSPVPPGNS